LYKSGFESFYLQAQKIKKALISTVLRLHDLLSLKTDVNVPTERNKQKNGSGTQPKLMGTSARATTSYPRPYERKKTHTEL
jgi:hypothetical protein